MPEGDTIWRTARRLNEALAGEVIIGADLRWPGLSTADLRGMRTLEVVSRGKNLLHRLDAGLTLHSHLRMDGQWRVASTDGLAKGTLANPQLRAVVSTVRWTALGLRLGDVHLLATREEHRFFGHLGPDVLGPDWDAAEAARRLTASKGTIGSALLDQRNLAGVGTLYASEALFLEGLNPWHPAAGLATVQVRRVVARVHLLLNVNRHNAIQSTTGIQHQGKTTYVHGRSGRPCRRCGDAVRVSVIGVPPQDRAFFYCPTCQGGLAAGDDGRRQGPLGSSARSPGRRRLGQ
ncbi:MAG: DNA-formamidopyrimidine glycosylase family protein [Dermatophilaceae bacterium]